MKCVRCDKNESSVIVEHEDGTVEPVCEGCYLNAKFPEQDEEEHAEEYKAIAMLERKGHSRHCASRQVWGDGECECCLFANRIQLLNTLDSLTEALGSSDGQSCSDVRQELIDEGIDVDKSLERLKAFHETIKRKAVKTSILEAFGELREAIGEDAPLLKDRYLIQQLPSLTSRANEIHLKILAFLQDKSRFLDDKANVFNSWWDILNTDQQNEIEEEMIEIISQCLSGW